MLLPSRCWKLLTLADRVKFLKLNVPLLSEDDINCTVAFSTDGSMLIMPEMSALASRVSPSYQSIIPLDPKFTASHVRVSISGHCSPDNSNNPILELISGWVVTTEIIRANPLSNLHPNYR